MREPQSRWELELFLDRLDDWIALEQPSEELRIRVTEQVLTRFEDPYRGVKRVVGHANLWFGVVPGSQHGEGMVVTWMYRVFESSHRVRCDQIASLRTPI